MQNEQELPLCLENLSKIDGGKAAHCFDEGLGLCILVPYAGELLKAKQAADDLIVMSLRDLMIAAGGGFEKVPVFNGERVA